MSGADRPIWFAGDLGDPLAAEIARALPVARTRRLDCPLNLPKPWPAVGDQAPRVVIVHRAHLGETDAGRLARLRRRLGPERRVILCVGPHVRYADIERWSPWIDLVLPEATAAETIGRHVGGFELVAGARSPQPNGRTIAVVSTNTELRATWDAILRLAGFEVVEAENLAGLSPRLPAVWDVPVLEADWPDRLAARCLVGPTIAAIGFLDRTTRALARSAGAGACLDMPCDLADLTRAVDRITGLRRDPAHPAIRPPTARPQPSERRQNKDRRD